MLQFSREFKRYAPRSNRYALRNFRYVPRSNRYAPICQPMSTSDSLNQVALALYIGVLTT